MFISYIFLLSFFIHPVAQLQSWTEKVSFHLLVNRGIEVVHTLSHSREEPALIITPQNSFFL